MRFDYSKKAATLVLLLLLAAACVAVALPFVSAHTPSWRIPTYSYLTVAPNPVGVKQTVAVMFWLDIPPPTAGGSGGDRWRNITITVTKPDSTTQSLGTFTSDPVGSGGTQFTPDQAGTYTFKLNFPGQVLSLYGPTGIPGDANNAYINDTYLPSEATAKLVVQQEPLQTPPAYPTPEGYWTRPIEGQNTNWVSVASNWLGGSQIVMRVQPNGAAPETSHIMWTKPLLFGGIVGGSYPFTDAMPYYPGPQYETKFSNPIIINGYLYYSVPLSDQSTGAGVACVNLRTGEQLWNNPDLTSIAFAQLYDYETPNQHGIIPNGYLWATSGTTWSAYDPLTGMWLFNITNVPSGTQVYGPSGEILNYVLSYNATRRSGWLALWNNTAAPSEQLGPSGTNAWQWRPIGKVVDGRTAYSWNVSVPALNGLNAPAIIKVIPDNMILGRSTTLQGAGSTSSATFGTPDPCTFWAISLKPESRGQLLWIKNYSAPEANKTLLVGPVDPETGVFTMEYRETMQWFGYDINNGNPIWGPTAPESAWNYYSGTSGALTSTTIAYGHLYTTGYSGILYCYDLKTGKLAFTYGNGGAGNSTNSGFSTVYGNYPTLIGAVADGKIYLFTSEHSPNTPLYEGALVRCVDANSGQEYWTEDGWVHSSTMAIADGYLTYLNLYDSQIYCIGKGPSATTVTAPQTVVPQGTGVMITGTVTDQSVGAKGTPAVSDQNMSAWMEHLYMQRPLPTGVTGVPVKLTATDQDGRSYSIGTVTSDNGGSYGAMWTPPAQGKYQITATFEGTKAYGGSYATTYVGVGPAAAPIPASTPTPTAPSTSPTTPASSPAATANPTGNPTAPSTPTPAPQPASETSFTAYIAIAAAATIAAVVAAALLLRRRTK